MFQTRAKQNPMPKNAEHQVAICSLSQYVHKGSNLHLHDEALKRKHLKGCDDDYFVHHGHGHVYAHAQLARLYYDGGVGLSDERALARTHSTILI
tara:strand:+ start:34 stop:318 length:285 start_codon:yes stop_codon:yes gene_type:complete